MSLLKIVQNNDVMPALQQYFRADTSNVPGAAGDQNVQRHFLHFGTEPMSRKSHRAPNYSRICSETLEFYTIAQNARKLGLRCVYTRFRVCLLVQLIECFDE